MTHHGQIDVSQFLLKEYSPQFKPVQAFHVFPGFNTPQNSTLTPEAIPMTPMALPEMMMTPYLFGRVFKADSTQLDGFVLEKDQRRRRKVRRSQQQEQGQSQFQTALLDEINNLNSEIFELEQEDDDSYSMVEVEEEDYEEVEDDDQHSFQQVVIDGDVISEVIFQVPVQDKYPLHTEADIRATVSRVLSTSAELHAHERLLEVREALQKFILNHEMPSYNEGWIQLEDMLAQRSFEECKLSLLTSLDETFSKKIGALRFSQRRVKVVRYLNKKIRRNWQKKVSYICRKNVADSRLRVKGKFVTNQQATLGRICLAPSHSTSSHSTKDHYAA